MSDILSSLENSLPTNTFWKEYRLLCSNLHEADLDLDRFILILPEVLKKIENNGISYQIYDALNKFSHLQPDRGLELYDRIKTTGNAELLILIPCILDGISKSDLTFNKFTASEFLLQNDSELLRNQGYAFVATLTEEELNQNRDFTDLVYNLIRTDIENDKTVFLSQIVRVLGKFMKVIPEADYYLIQLSKSDSQDVLYQIVRLLGYQFDAHGNIEFFEKLLSNLIRVDPGDHGIISQLSHGVFPKLITDKPELIEKFLKGWLITDRRRAGEIVVFGDTIEELHEKNPDYFKKMITIWLNSDDSVFHNAASRLLMHLPHYEIKNLELYEKYLAGLNYMDIQFITAKIVGYIYFKELIRSSIFSILKAKIDDQQCVVFLKAIFNDYVVFNYPSTIEYLEEEKRRSSKKVQSVIDEIIEVNTSYYEKINGLDPINEFNPSDKRLQIYNSIHQKGFQAKQKEISEGRNSFFDMCRTIQLRAGKGMFSKHEGVYTEKTEMSRIQYSTEFPRGEFIDVIGQEKIRAFYRNYKREK